MSRSVHNTHILSEIDRTTSVNRASYILLRRNLGITWWNKWRLKYRSWAIDCMYKDCQLFDGFKKRCQTWHRLLSTRSIPCHVWHRFLTPCLASKSFQTSYLQSIAQLWQSSLQLFRGSGTAGGAPPFAMYVSGTLSVVFGCSRNLWRPYVRLKCWSLAIDCSMTSCLLFDARHGVKNRCQIWHRISQC